MTAFLGLVAAVWGHAPRLARRHAGLLVAQIVMEGAGLLLLVPLLALAGLAPEAGGNWITRHLSAVLARLGLTADIGTVLAVFVALMLLRAVVGYLASANAARLQLGFLHDLRTGLHRDVTGADWPFLAAQDSGTVSHALSIQCEHVAYGVSALSRLLVTLLAVAISFAVALAVDARLTLLVILLAVAVAIPMIVYDVRAYRLGSRSVAVLEELFKRLSHQLDDLKAIKSMHGETFARATFTRLSASYTDIAMRRMFNGAQASFVHELAAASVLAGMVWLVLAFRDSLQAEPVAIAIIVARLFPKARDLQAAVRDLLGVVPEWKRLDGLRRAAGDRREALAASDGEPLRLADRLTLDGVSFRYPGSTALVLDGVSMEVAAGTAVGIAGVSGIGKTTLLDVMAGLLQPVAGSVRVDGAPLDAGRLLAWRRTVAYCLQDAQLVNDTVRANVTPFEDRPDDEAVWRALRLAGAEAIVRDLPRGLDTELGERGSRLSRGQRQRLSLARALYARPSVLFLDEATSALNPIDEQAIVATLRGLAGTTTIVMVAHRLSSLMWTDTLHVLDHGRIVAHGPPAHLVKNRVRIIRDME